MAGYIFNLNTLASVAECFRTGIYSTFFKSQPARLWDESREGTFADYATMRPDDEVYFFSKRKIYGIGRLVDLGNGCALSNFPDASKPLKFDPQAVRASALLDAEDLTANHRWLCTFQPSPHFFREGVDMDDVLLSNPAAFRSLRAMERVSFIKFEDTEAQAFRDIVLRSNEESLVNPDSTNTFAFDETEHERIARMASAQYRLDVGPLLTSCATGNKLDHEMAIEAGLAFQLTRNENTSFVFDNWDYVSHQVLASPFKPLIYVDKMDLFGFAHIPNHAPTRSKYLVGEIKRDSANSEDVNQVMRYVDWLRDEYVHGDYSMIRAFLIAHDFTTESLDLRTELAARNYTIGRRPAITRAWDDLTLVKYALDASIERLVFSVAAGPPR